MRYIVIYWISFVISLINVIYKKRGDVYMRKKKIAVAITSLVIVSVGAVGVVQHFVCGYTSIAIFN